MSKAIETAVAKFAVAFVAVAMLFSLVAPAANAQTTDELQQMINDLLAQVASLQGQLGGGDAMSASGVCPYTWTRSLGQGDTGMDVMKLQQFLNSDAETMVSASGAGSAGMETEYYGPATAAAVSKMQVKYRSDVLTPAGLVNPTGFFGPSSMAKANALCVVTEVEEEEEEEEEGEEEGEEEESSEMSDDEASLEDFNLKSGDDTDLEEGQENAPVAEVEFDVEDGDVEINRMDVAFDPDGTNDEMDPWDTFETVSVWVDGDMIAEVDADDEDEWEEDTPNTGDYRLRITGLDARFDEDDTAEMVIAVTVQGSVDGTNNGEDWDVFVPTDGIRGRDGAGIDQYTGDTTDTQSFTIEEEGNEDELKIQSSSDDPDADTFSVEDNSNSDWFTVLAFDLDTDDSVNDIVVDTAVVAVIVAGDVYDDVVNDARLVIDGEEYDDFSVSGNTTATATLTFDLDKELEIEAGDEVTAELQLEFNGTDSGTAYSEGQTVQATTTAAMGGDWDAEGADDLTVGTQLTGSATGEVHTLRTEGIILEMVGETTDTQGDSDDTGVFEIEFSVTAFEGDFYIAENATSSNSNTDGGVYFSVEGPAAPTSASGVLASSADEDTAGVFTVREGETETFTMTVTVDASASGQHRVLLNDVWYTDNSDGVSSLSTDPATPAQDYRTGYENVNA